jgi:hypothetical protein
VSHIPVRSDAGIALQGHARRRDGRADKTDTNGHSNGESTRGCFFLAGDSSRHDGPERVSDLLNSEGGFVPFEIHHEDGRRTVLYNRAHIVLVALDENDATLDPGYSVATRRCVPAHRRLERGAGVMSEGNTIDPLFRAMFDAKASDLHLCVGSLPIVRKDGHMQPLDTSRTKSSGWRGSARTCSPTARGRAPSFA